MGLASFVTAAGPLRLAVGKGIAPPTLQNCTHLCGFKAYFLDLGEMA